VSGLPRPRARDRDEHGRARNARQRDVTGRPLDGPRQVRPPPTGRQPVDPATAPRDADSLVAAGRPFAAHELLEEVWHSCSDGRAGWRGLTQLAVGLTHLQRGNTRGATALLRRGAAALLESPIRGVPAELPFQAGRLADAAERGENPQPVLRFAEDEPPG
jgi:hypothetical protein